jgi:enoyl-CoA hydratase/carnithine racemase
LQRYVSRFGLAATKRAFLTARPFTDRQLEALGLFEALVGPGDWAATQQALVRDLLALAPVAVQDTKQSIREIEAGMGDVARMRERELRSSQSADFAEGRAAFAQRRAPVFSGL